MLPEVFDRFKQAAAKPTDLKKGTEAIFTAENLEGLPNVFRNIGLLRDEKGKTVFRTGSGPLKEVLDRIEERANYGDTASGRYLNDEFAKEPFGWDFEVVRLLVLSLLRSGKIEATSKGQTIGGVTGVEARDTFSNNNLFRQAAFRPKKGIEFEELVKASEAFRDTFGSEVRELNAGGIVAELRKEVAKNEDTVSSALRTLTANRLPGGDVLNDAIDQMKAILRGSEDNAIATFNTSHRAIRDAILRAVELGQVLSEARLQSLERARTVQTRLWGFLSQEFDIAHELRARAASLEDLLARETFFKELPSIDRHMKAVEAEYARRFEQALAARATAYAEAFDSLVRTPGWSNIDEDQQPPPSRTLRPGTKAGCRDHAHSTASGRPRRVRRSSTHGHREALAALSMANGSSQLASAATSQVALRPRNSSTQHSTGVREECARLIGAGKKVIAQ